MRLAAAIFLTLFVLGLVYWGLWYFFFRYEPAGDPDTVEEFLLSLGSHSLDDGGDEEADANRDGARRQADRALLASLIEPRSGSRRLRRDDPSRKLKSTNEGE